MDSSAVRPKTAPPRLSPKMSSPVVPSFVMLSNVARPRRERNRRSVRSTPAIASAGAAPRSTSGSTSARSALFSTWSARAAVWVKRIGIPCGSSVTARATSEASDVDTRAEAGGTRGGATPVAAWVQAAFDLDRLLPRLLLDRLLVDVGVGARILDQAVAEGGDVLADHVQDSPTGRGALLEEVDDPREQIPLEQVDRPDLEQVLLHLLVDDLVVRREGFDPRLVRPPLLLAFDDVLDAHVSLPAGPVFLPQSCSAVSATDRGSSRPLHRRRAPCRSPRCRPPARPGRSAPRPRFPPAAPAHRRGSASGCGR